jgi:hypothetical protein
MQNAETEAEQEHPPSTPLSICIMRRREKRTSETQNNKNTSQTRDELRGHAVCCVVRMLMMGRNKNTRNYTHKTLHTSVPLSVYIISSFAPTGLVASRLL